MLSGHVRWEELDARAGASEIKNDTPFLQPTSRQHPSILLSRQLVSSRAMDANYDFNSSWRFRLFHHEM
jgi:hypothetical protein